MGHKVFDGALHRSLMLAEHLLDLEGGVVPQEAVGDIDVLKAVLL